jgi:FMN phosphatase YigB (HAD superfamily)
VSRRPPSQLPHPLRAVTFDCWRTLLVERDWSVAHALRVDALVEAAKRVGRDSDRAELSGVFDAAWNRHIARWTCGVASGAAEVARDALEILGLSAEGAGFAALVTSWEEASHSGAVKAVDGSLAHLGFLSSAGVRLGVICDTGLTPGRVVRHLLHDAGLLTYFDVCVFSDEVGVPKPDPRIFHTALDALAADASHSVHVGDLLRTDIAGARGVGMASIRIRAAYDDPSEQPEAIFSSTPTPSFRRSSSAQSADRTRPLTAPNPPTPPPDLRSCTWVGSVERAASCEASAFSPEDLYSNVLGTKIASATAFAGGARSEILYARSADAWLRAAVNSLGPASKQTAIEAMRPGWNLVAVRSAAPRSQSPPAPRHLERRHLHPLARTEGAGFGGTERACAARVRRLAEPGVPDDSYELRRHTATNAGEARAVDGSGDRESAPFRCTGIIRDAGRLSRHPGGDPRTEPPRIRPSRRSARLTNDRGETTFRHACRRNGTVRST